jgi:hypothetical protein
MVRSVWNDRNHLNLKTAVAVSDLRKILARKRFGATPQIREGYAASLRTPFSLKLLQISDTFNCRFKVNSFREWCVSECIETSNREIFKLGK